MSWEKVQSCIDPTIVWESGEPLMHDDPKESVSGPMCEYPGGENGVRRRRSKQLGDDEFIEIEIRQYPAPELLAATLRYESVSVTHVKKGLRGETALLSVGRGPTMLWRNISLFEVYLGSFTQKLCQQMPQIAVVASLSDEVEVFEWRPDAGLFSSPAERH